MSATSHLDRAPSLADVLAQRLEQDIAQGHYAPGEKLPSEQQLATTYGVSRPIVREAIGRLKHDGLVTSRQGSGAFVAESGGASVFRLDVSNFKDREEIESLIELLMAIEQDLIALGHQLEAMQAAIERGDSGVDEDVAFHRAIVEATKNPFFMDLSTFLDRRVRHFIRTARANTAKLQTGHMMAVQDEHRDIFNAIRDKDAQRARQAAENHLKRAAQRLAIYMKRV